jgi:hypothetical protein
MERDLRTKKKMDELKCQEPEDFRLKKGVDRFVIGFKSTKKDEEKKVEDEDLKM